MKPNPKWEESLKPQIEQARAQLRERDPRRIAQDCGAVYFETEEGLGHLRLPFFGRLYTISWPELEVRDPEGEVSPIPVQATLLQHLVLADGTPLENRWVSLGELPNGAFYERAFQGYSGNMLIRTIRGDIEGFKRAAEKLGGEPLDMGDASFRFWALPRIPLAVVYWSGGEEFPPTAQVLFDASAGHYHHLEMLAHIGAMICDRIVETYKASKG